MKLLRVIRSLDPSGGGPAEGIRRITPHLNALGVTTLVATLDEPNAEWLQEKSLKAIGLGPVSKGYGYRRHMPAKILNLARQHDIVIIHGIWQYHALATWRALHRTNIPYLVYPHGMLDPWFKRAYPLKHIKKYIYWPWAITVMQRLYFSYTTGDVVGREVFRPYKGKE